ncbi:hypothetical protein BaRGS_00016054 [Batillaria attramentaria]|uniref:Uncharacterized protein n=1 Tax=Batillaria attramentaria TaxID=370345 RepID=A0ABD0KZT5_9CAEN
MCLSNTDAAIAELRAGDAYSSCAGVGHEDLLRISAKVQQRRLTHLNLNESSSKPSRRSIDWKGKQLPLNPEATFIGVIFAGFFSLCDQTFGHASNLSLVGWV